jgi:hypothetical protein
VRALAGRVDGWLFAPAPPERLAVLRVLVAGFGAVYLAVRLPVFLALADADPSRFDPVGVLSPLRGPLPDAALVALVLVAPVLGVALAVGFHARVTGPAFGVALLALATYRSSWGQLLHFENLLVLQVLIVGCTRSADVLSWDATRGRARAVDPDAHAVYGWPVRLAALVTVITYVLAGLAKLRLGGLDWMLGDTLRNHVAYSALRLDLLGGTASPFGRALVDHAWVFPPAAVATVLVELAAPVALAGGRVRTVWVVAAWTLHAAVALLMFVVFPFPLFLVAFAPLFDLERLASWIPRTPISRQRPA